VIPHALPCWLPVVLRKEPIPLGLKQDDGFDGCLHHRMRTGGSLARSRPGAGASVVVVASVDVAAGRFLCVRGSLSSSRGRRARRRLAEDDAPVAAAVTVAARGLPALGADPLDERRYCGQHDAGKVRCCSASVSGTPPASCSAIATRNARS